MFGAEERAGQVRSDNAVPLFERKFFNRAGDADRRIVDQRIKRAEGIDCLLDGPNYVGFTAHIAGDRHSALTDRGFRLFQIEYGDQPIFFEQRVGDYTTDSFRTARNQGNAPVMVDRLFSQP